MRALRDAADDRRVVAEAAVTVKLVEAIEDAAMTSSVCGRWMLRAAGPPPSAHARGELRGSVMRFASTGSDRSRRRRLCRRCDRASH